jgi:hypothetical protein
MKRLIVIVAAVSFVATTAEARVWRPEGRRPISGDFRELVGNEVRIRTRSSTESVPYKELPEDDRAYVRSQLLRKGLDSEIARLAELTGDATTRPSESGNQKPTDGTDGSAPQSPTGGTDGGFFGGGIGAAQPTGQSRTWTDVRGNSLSAQFVRVIGTHVVLIADGRQQSFPVSEFSQADQQWLAENGGSGIGTGAGSRNGTTGQTGSMPLAPEGGTGSLPGDGARGRPGFPMRPGMPNIPGARGRGFEVPGAAGSGFPIPGGPGYPAMPSDGGISGVAGDLSGNVSRMGDGIGMPGGSASMPNMPGGGFPRGNMPGSPMNANGIGGNPGNFAGPGSAMVVPGGAGFTPPTYEPPSFEPPPFEPPAFEPPTFEPPPMPDIPVPSWGRMNGDVLTCENCGAEFTETSSLREGDDCPNCNGGSSFRFGSARGLVKLVIGLGVLAVAGISVFWKKISGN